MRHIVVLGAAVLACAGRRPPPTPAPMSLEVACSRALDSPGMRRVRVFNCNGGRCESTSALPSKDPVIFAVEGTWEAGGASIGNRAIPFITGPAFIANGTRTTVFVLTSHRAPDRLPIGPGRVTFSVWNWSYVEGRRHVGMPMGCIVVDLVAPRLEEPAPQPTRVPPHTI